MSGWVKLHRSLQKWGWKKSPNHTAVFIDLLLEANHEDGEYFGTPIPRGSLTTSIKAISERSGVTEKRVRTILTHLKQTNEVAIKTTQKYTMISIVKWDDYQIDGKEMGKQRANEGQTKGKQRATNKNLRIKEVKNNQLSEQDFTSPLNPMFPDSPEIQEWLNTGTEKLHTSFIEKYDDQYLKQQIENAFLWKDEKKIKRQASGYLKQWLERDKNPTLKALSISAEEETKNQAAREFFKSKFGHYPDEVQSA